ncbi:Pathogen-associated molecular patterns-induced protein A70 [Sesamum alatum]|uniref:Pathogen-associated molecular patterns-induced protein A70 n=1 Tax=Sesamum alatum TaxID=300844 RepID=A0AAE1XIL3_9LAMI|nr:Pathogen-associated molecular patterns-induced protein A70 [Sesamum alatum]
MLLQLQESAIPSSIWASINSWFTPTLLFLFLNLMIATIVFTSSHQNHKHKHKHHFPPNDDHQHHDNHIANSPSLLRRLKSINFSTHHHTSQEPQVPSPPHKPNTDSETLFDTYRGQHLETQTHYFFQDSSRENLENPSQSSQDHYVSQEETQTHFVSEEKDDDFQQAGEEKVVLDENIEQSMDDDVHDQCQTRVSHFSRTKSDTEPASGEVSTKLPARMRKSASLKSAFAHFEEEDIMEARRPATVREKGSAKVTEGDEEVDAKADDFINRFKQQLKLQRLDSIIRYKDMIGRGSASVPTGGL